MRALVAAAATHRPLTNGLCLCIIVAIVPKLLSADIPRQRWTLLQEGILTAYGRIPANYMRGGSLSCSLARKDLHEVGATTQRDSDSQSDDLLLLRVHDYLPAELARSKHAQQPTISQAKLHPRPPLCVPAHTSGQRRAAEPP